LGRYIAKRAGYFVLLLLGVSVIVFGSIRLVPGDPIIRLAGPFATEKQRAQVRQSYGLDQPIAVQYVRWLGKAASGDFGHSMQLHVPVGQLLMAKAGNTLLLVLGSMLIAILAGWSLGIAAGLRPGSWMDNAALVVGLTGISLPAFWFGMVLVILFAINVNLFPASGITTQRGGGGGVLDVLWHLVLPALATSVLPAGMLIRMCRTAVIDIARQPFVNALYARGLPERIVRRHIVRNAFPTILNVTGMQAGFLLTAAIFSEVVFAWPGLGLQIYTAVIAQDYSVVQGAVLLVCVLFLAFNIIVDVLRPLFDPRISLQ
jgi:peptide/nickel transport system permease protein